MLQVRLAALGAVLALISGACTGSPALDPAVAAVWKKAFDGMVSDGTYNSLLTEYGFERIAR